MYPKNQFQCDCENDVNENANILFTSQNNEKKKLHRTTQHQQQQQKNKTPTRCNEMPPAKCEKLHTLSVFVLCIVNSRYDEQDRVLNVCLNSPNYGKRLKLVYGIGWFGWSECVSTAVIFSASFFFLLF